MRWINRPIRWQQMEHKHQKAGLNSIYSSKKIHWYENRFKNKKAKKISNKKTKWRNFYTKVAGLTSSPPAFFLPPYWPINDPSSLNLDGSGSSYSPKESVSLSSNGLSILSIEPLVATGGSFLWEKAGCDIARLL